jgi:hypothetical protein
MPDPENQLHAAGSPTKHGGGPSGRRDPKACSNALSDNPVRVLVPLLEFNLLLETTATLTDEILDPHSGVINGPVRAQDRPLGAAATRCTALLDPQRPGRRASRSPGKTGGCAVRARGGKAAEFCGHNRGLACPYCQKTPSRFVTFISYQPRLDQIYPVIC